jgi:hypothetical protein
MANIKLGRPAEKFLSLEGLKERIMPAAEKEKARELEQARREIISEIIQKEGPAPAIIGPVAQVAAPAVKQQKQIEKALAKGLDDIYLNLAPEKRKQFKQAGEETAAKINKLLAKVKVNLGAIVKLIRKWLSLIPGINKYFLEQEAKIKADEIIKLKQEN